MSSRHHARQSTRVIHCISELSKASFFLLSLFELKSEKVGLRRVDFRMFVESEWISDCIHNIKE